MKILFLILLFLGFQAQAKSTAYLLTRYMAKEYCSCRYVVKQSKKVCINENKTTKILFSVEEDQENKIVRVRNLVAKAQARFIDRETGCLLDQ